MIALVRSDSPSFPALAARRRRRAWRPLVVAAAVAGLGAGVLPALAVDGPVTKTRAVRYAPASPTPTPTTPTSTPCAGSPAAPLLDLCSGTYVPRTTGVAGVADTGAGSVVAVTLDDGAAYPSATGVAADARGAVLLLDRAGAVVAGLRVGDEVSDVSTSGDRLAVATDRGVTLLDTSDLAVEREVTLSGGAERVDLDGGTVAALGGRTVTVVDAAGTRSTSVGRDFVEDVAVDEAAGLVHVVGYSNRRNDGVPVQVAFLQARTTAGLDQRWDLWDYDPQTLDADMADTRAYRVDTDGRTLVVAGESAGGNSIYRWDGRDLSTRTNIRTGPSDDPFNTKSNHIGYLAVVDTAQRAVSRGSFVVPRLSSGAGNTFRVRDGAVAVQGSRVVLGGESACCVPDRDSLRVEGRPVGDYAGSDANVLVYDLALARERWQAFSLVGGKGTTPGVALAADGTVSLAVDRTAGTFVPEDRAPVPSPADDDDVWVASFR